jgi:hypothetical protein
MRAERREESIGYDVGDGVVRVEWEEKKRIRKRGDFTCFSLIILGSAGRR